MTPPIAPRVARLRRRLLAVLLSDASATAALVAVAVATGSRPSGRRFAAIAGVAVASFAPGAVAVLRERHAHRPGSARPHRLTPTTLLLAAGLAINSAGTIAALAAGAPLGDRRRAAVVVGVLLLIAGDLVGMPYLVLARALHVGAGEGSARPGRFGDR